MLADEGLRGVGTRWWNGKLHVGAYPLRCGLIATDHDHEHLGRLLAAARRDGRRRVLGLTGSPGAGKSTLAAELVGVGSSAGSSVGSDAGSVVVVGMDGWHLANSELDRLDRRDDGDRRERKGAPDTFDAAGYVAFLDRVRDRSTTVWAPEFRRAIEEPVAGAIAVDPEVDVVVTEGNYLLLDEQPWDRIRGLLDEVWFLAPDEVLRRARLVARHRHFGRSEHEAADRADGSDAINARLVAATAVRADRIVPVT